LINNPNEDEPANCQWTSEKMNAICEIEVLCGKFQSLSVENDEIEEDIGTAHFFISYFSTLYSISFIIYRFYCKN